MFLFNRQLLIKAIFFMCAGSIANSKSETLVSKKETPSKLSIFVEQAKPMANKLAKSELPAITVAFLVRACYDRSFLPLGKFADNCLPGLKDSPLSNALTTELTCATIELLMNTGGSFIAEQLNLKTDDEFEENAFVEYLFDIFGECAETAGDLCAPTKKEDEGREIGKKLRLGAKYKTPEAETKEEIAKDLANTIVIQKTLPTLIKKLASHPLVAEKLCSDAEKAIFILTKYILPKAKLHGLFFGETNYKKSAKGAFVKWAGDTVLEKIRTKERINHWVKNKNLKAFLNRCIGTTLGMYLSHAL